jgi:DNA-binding transcriptional LysR family regulator
VEERFDVGIRAGALADSTLIAKSLGSASWFLVATPAYLKKHGQPKYPDDLKTRPCLLFGAIPDSATLRLEKGGKSVQVAVTPRLLVTDMDVLYAVAVSGLGLALLPAFRCAEELRARRFTRVLAEWNARPHQYTSCIRALATSLPK